MDSRIRIIKLASYISIGGNFILAILKIAIGFHSGSLAVVGDGMDSFTDIAISLVTLYTAVIIAQPPDRQHPYGHSRAETVATIILSFFIFFIGGQLSLAAIEKIFAHTIAEMPDTLAIYITVISIIGKYLLARSQMYLGKKAGSEMITANAKNMQLDILTSLSVLLGLGAGYVFHMPILDKVLATLIGFWIMYTAIGIFMNIVMELMEGVRDDGLYASIYSAVSSTPGALNPHRTRVRKIGAWYVVDLDIEVDGGLTVREAHEISSRVESAIKGSINRVYDVIVHIEPVGNIEDSERYGRSPEEQD